MTDSDTTLDTGAKAPGPFAIAINIFTAPREAFAALEQKPSKLFPLLVVICALSLTFFWYFSIVDFDWYVDDALSLSNVPEAQLDDARETMLGMGQTTFMWIGMGGAVIGILVIWTIQAGYLALVSALSGDRFKFSNWFSLVAWTGLTALLSAVGMVVNIVLTSNGQLSAYDLDPLTLANLGMQSSNGSLQTIFRSINLPMFWSAALMVMAYRQWLQSSWQRAAAIVLGPYVVIFGLWAFSALT